MKLMSSKADRQSPTAGETVVFRPERTHVLAAAVMTMIFVMMIGHAPLYLVWILLLPAAVIYWVFRARTTVGESGVAVQYAFRGNRTFTWDEISGVSFRRSRALLNTADGGEHSLPGVTFNSLPLLREASRGRIPDVLTAGRAAADDKVVVYDRDGESTLISKEEYARREAEKQAHGTTAETAEQTVDSVSRAPQTDAGAETESNRH